MTTQVPLRQGLSDSVYCVYRGDMATVASSKRRVSGLAARSSPMTGLPLVEWSPLEGDRPSVFSKLPRGSELHGDQEPVGWEPGICILPRHPSEVRKRCSEQATLWKAKSCTSQITVPAPHHPRPWSQREGAGLAGLQRPLVVVWLAGAAAGSDQRGPALHQILC